ncbi:hypothetical protein TNCV_3399461 [Trichonephila clavipes]|nr:hypothetical protein TNCV_3399461 [Trichonephila clavipes]
MQIWLCNRRERVHPTPEGHWRHRFPMLFIKLSGHRNRKRRPDTESGDRLAIPFVPNRDPPDAPTAILQTFR